METGGGGRGGNRAVVALLGVRRNVLKLGIGFQGRNLVLIEGQ